MPVALLRPGAAPDPLMTPDDLGRYEEVARVARVLDPRQHVRVHSGMPEHPKVEPLSDAAFRCLVEAWCLCRRTGNDGRIPASVWVKRWKAKPRKELLAAGLAVLDGTEVEMHDWLDHQPSAAELDAKRSVRAEAGRKGGLRSGEARAKQTASTGEANAEAIASIESGQEMVTTDEISSESSTRTRIPEWPVDNVISEQGKAAVPADMAHQGEANASTLLQRDLKPSGTEVQPDKDKDKDIGGHLGGNGTKVTRELRASAPPKHHPGHDEYDPDCADCERTARRYERHVALALADTEPSPHCARHPGGTLDNCRDCGRARAANAQWHEDRRHAAALAQSEAARESAEARAAAIADCPLCDVDGYAGRALCDHDPDAADRNRRGAEAARAALREARAAKEARPA